MKIEVISDTHCKEREVKLQSADVLIHCGDFSYTGSEPEIIDFLVWISEIEHNYKKVLIIPGNHDASFIYQYPLLWKEAIKTYTNNTVDLWTETYSIGEVYKFEGLTFSGFPFVPYYIDVNGFFLEASRHDKLVENIVAADCIVSHGPPKRVMDLGGRKMEHLGSQSFYDKILEIKPKLVCFGHIHESYKPDPVKLGETLYVNAAQCDYPNYDITGTSVIVEI